MVKGDKRNIEKMYQKMTPHEHVLKLPDTYIGSIKPDRYPMRVFDEETKKIVLREIQFVPGFYKIFDEVLVNALDHTVRDKTCKNIMVDIDVKNTKITVFNDGSGIPVEIHPKEKMYVPEMIFGHLLTSGNYQEKKKIVGGKNGVGGKCVASCTFLPFYDGKIKQAKDVKVGDQLIGDDGRPRTVKKVIKGEGQLYKIEQSLGETYYVNDQHTLSLLMPDHKVIFWNNAHNGWQVLWWDKEQKKIRTKKESAGHPYLTCEICDSQIHSNMNRHYKRKHPGIDVPKTLRKSPSKGPSIMTKEIKDARERLEKFCESIDDDKTLDITIEEYLKLDKTTQGRLAGLSGDGVHWDKKDVELDPYMLGLWLGDGHKTGLNFSINDKLEPEILDYITEWCRKNGAQITKTRDYTFKISSIEKGTSPLKTLLAKYNLINNKHIPEDYIVNDRDTRLKVLAGLIDTDGHVMRDGTRIKLAQSLEHKPIIDGLVLISRSLGFNTSVTKINTSWTWQGEKKTGFAYNVNISGKGLEDIPTLIARKKCASPKSHDTSKSNGKITVTKDKIGEYVGFEIDGNQRFVLNDFTATHNCANIYSTEFWIETVDSKTRQRYTQRFYNNMYNKDEPKIEKVKKSTESYTKITFIPDLEKFEMKSLDPDTVSLFKKRVYDCAGVTDPRVNVFLNGELLKIKTFSDYIQMFISDDSDTETHSKPIYQKINDRWEVGVLYDPSGGFNHISYVNGICTYQGGTHVNNVTDKIVNGLMKIIKEKHKDLKVKSSQIKDNLTIFIKSTIEDPAFNSQVKEFLTTKVAEYGSKCEFDDEFIKNVAKTGIIDAVINFAKLKEMSEMKKTDGKKKIKLKGLDKLEDAEYAGGKNSAKATLILTEGDSAKPFAMAAREVVGCDRIGVFPLKGKPLNVREATAKQLKTNEEIINIKQILGLKQGHRYKDTKDLRYGKVLILTDSDVDGTHIKGLVMNLFHFFWPSLLKIDGFIQSYATPIVKAFKSGDKAGKHTKKFYTLSEYRKWSETSESKNYTARYYKGLGTSTNDDAKEAFQNFDENVINYIWDKCSTSRKYEEEKIDTESESDTDPKDECNKAINLAFAKINTDRRKEWLRRYDKDKIIENSIKRISVSRFINEDLIHFSNSDNIRSIPSIVDGFKPSQRKIIYGCFKRNLLKDSAKVSQLAGYISDVAQYHHGETSLQGAIIGMGQDFVGSNNLNLLVPEGNFGTRIQGGKDASSARYIFTKLSDVVPYIFREEDNPIIKYTYEDGDQAEPEVYPTIVPMILINGGEGIGTGFSTNVPCYNPIDVVNNLKRMLQGKEPVDMNPWYRNFTGDITKKDDTTYESKGIYDIVNETTIKITELPVKMWSQDYKKFLEQSQSDDSKKSSEKSFIADYVSNCTNTKIDFTVTLCKGVLHNLQKNSSLSKKKDTIEGRMKLTSNIKTSNMHLYNTKNVITKYLTSTDILREFFEYRKDLYRVRKEHRLRFLKNKMDICYYRRKYIKLVLAKKIVVMNKKQSEVIEQIEEHKFPKLHLSDPDASESEKSYDYIKKLLIFHLTQEKIEEIEAEYQEKKKELDDYKKLTIEEIWTSELDQFLEKYKIWEKETRDNDSAPKKQKKKNIKSKVRSK